MPSLFAGLKNAAVSERGTFMQAGQYKVRVTKAIMKAVRTGGHAFILEFKIEDSNYAAQKQIRTNGVTDIAVLETIEKTLPNKPGTTASWFQSLKDTSIGFGALKGFAAAVLGQNPEDPEFINMVEPFLEQVVNGDEEAQKLAAASGKPVEGALNGALLPLETIMIQTKPKPGAPNGTPFTLFKFGQIIDETPAS